MSNKIQTVYISGPITGYNLKEVKERFENYESLLRKNGYIPVNPLKDVPDDAPTYGTDYEKYMREDLKNLLSCDAIFQMEGWCSSLECRLENNIATVCSIPLLIYNEAEYIFLVVLSSKMNITI